MHERVCSFRTSDLLHSGFKSKTNCKGTGHDEALQLDVALYVADRQASNLRQADVMRGACSKMPGSMSCTACADAIRRDCLVGTVRRHTGEASRSEGGTRAI